MLAYQVSMLPRLKGTAVYTSTLAYFCRRWGEGPTPRHRHLTGATVRQTEKDNMLSTQQKFSIGYFILTLLGLLLIQTVFFAPQSENLSYRDFKTLLKAGKVVDLLLGERTITGRLTTDGLEGLLPPEKIAELRRIWSRRAALRDGASWMIPPSSRIWRPLGCSFRDASRVTGWAHSCPGSSRPWCSWPSGDSSCGVWARPVGS